MIRWVVLLVILATMPTMAALQYLVKSTPGHTNFDTGLNNTWDAGDDATHASVNLGFSFPFANTSYSSIYINANGMLSFTDSTSGSSTAHDRSLSSTSSPTSKYQIFPYWDDLYVPPSGSTNGQVKHGRLDANSANDRFVIEWDNVTHFLTRNDTNRPHFRFQVVLYKDGSIRFRYDSTSSANGHAYGGDTNDAGATIGVRENASHYDQSRNGSGFDNTKDILYTPVPPPSSNDYSDFHFDELSWNGTHGEVKDSHWNNDGTGYGVKSKSVPGKICQAMDLTKSSTTDYVKLGEKALDGAGDFTISVWHKGATGSDSNSLLSGARQGQDNELIFWYTNSTTFRPYIDNKNKVFNSTPNISDGSWHHLVWRQQGTEACYFFDGVKQACKNFNNTHTLSIESLILGQEQDSVGGGFSASQDWEGAIDELMIFRRALTDTEIETGYTNQLNKKNWDGTTRTCPYPSITKTSCVISDPVNNTTNPKRIPGAKIRYAIELSNPNTSTIEDANASDTLNTDFDTSTIVKPKVKDGACGNCVSLSNGSDSGSVSGNHVEVNFDNVSGGTLANPTKKCGYFEVEIK